MIIDFHTHPVTKDLLEASIEFFKRIGALKAIEWYSSLNLSIEGLIEEMNKAGVTKAVIVALDYNIEPPLLKISNDRIAGIVRQYPEKFIGFASVCPTEIINGKSVVTKQRVQRCVEELRRSVNELGLRGLKLLPPFQRFYPNDRLLWPLYEEVQRLKIPLLIHTGGEDFPGLVKYCNPIYIDDVAKAFPEIPIVLAHMGSYPFGVWFEEAMMIADENPNIYVDLAALRPRELIDLKLLERAISWIGSEKIIFGSDWPVVFDYSTTSAVKTIKTVVLNERDLENIMFRNAAKLLKLKI